MENSALTQVSQIGVETTPGVAVAATKLLQSIGFSASAQVSNRIFRPTGQKYGTVAALGRDWTQFSVDADSVPTFDELIYPLSSILGAAVVTTPAGAVNARTWTFSPSSIDADVAKTFTIEKGNSVRAVEAAYAIFSALNINFGRDDVTLGGTVMARAMVEGTTLTPNPTALPLVPVNGSDVSVYSDDTFGDLGTTKLLRDFRANWGISNKVAGVWPLDAAQSSFAAHVETDPDPTLQLTPAVNDEGAAFLAALRAGASKFIRLEAVGPIIEADIPYKLTIDQAVKVREVAEYSEEDGTYVLPYTFEIVNDGGWGRAMQVSVTNTQAAL